jgi:hypothetical protein
VNRAAAQAYGRQMVDWPIAVDAVRPREQLGAGLARNGNAES